MTERTAVSVVPHTHWDREWYAPFQRFRLRLVDLLDRLLDDLDADPSYAHFLLDGQMAVVDDYLAVRPEAEGRLRRLVASGRLAVGPWYVLMDEFLVSGETIVRNLQRGLERAAAFGGATPVGYLPDMFGHIAQMPQLLRSAGFGHAVVWRGVPASVDRSAFAWSSPDGSTVRAQYLWPEGYSNGAVVPEDAKELLDQVRTALEVLGERRLGPLLWMNGTDHLVPSPWLGRVVAEADELAGDLDLRITSLAEHVAASPPVDEPAVRGELRSGARANLLMGVTSNRVDVRMAAARAEAALERRAEPLSALFLPPAAWPATLLDEAWLATIRNSAHDSVCACSHDDVTDAVLVRYAEARHLAEGLAASALERLAAAVPPGPVVVNPSGRARGGVVELRLPGAGPVDGGQVLAERRAEVFEATVAGRELGPVLERFRSAQFDAGTYLNRVEVDEGVDEVHVTMTASDRLRDDPRLDDLKRDLLALAETRPDTPFVVRVVQRPHRKVLVRVPEVPGFGWAAWTEAPLDVPPVTAHGTTLANGLVTVEVDPGDGTFAVDGLAGFDRLVDGGDHGDTYNWNPPDTDRLDDVPERVEVEVAEAGPVRGRLVVRRRYRWPERVDDEARARVGDVEVEVATTLELRAGERLVRVTTELDNRARDHRLRTHLPLPARATTSTAECAFGVVERGTAAEGGPTEVALPTFPAKRFVRAGGLTVVHEGVTEYELVDLDDDGTAATLALTLLRATGMLSRVEMAMRPLPAGPPLPVEGPQLQGRVVRRYGVALDGAGSDLDPWALADDALLPLEVVVGAGPADAGSTGSALAVRGAEVSSVVRRDGLLEVRVFNPSTEPVSATIEGRSGWLVDLRGRPLQPFDGTFELPPAGIATARLLD